MAQKNRNDRLFIIAQPLCRRGKSIIKTRLTAKITAMSSIVKERDDFFFFLPQGSLDQSGITLLQFALHLKSHCLLELDLPDSFTQWMDSPSSGERKEWDSMWNCLRSHEVLDLSGTSLSAINLPTVRMSSLRESTEGSWRGGSESRTLKQRNNMQVM